MSPGYVEERRPKNILCTFTTEWDFEAKVLGRFLKKEARKGHQIPSLSPPHTETNTVVLTLRGLTEFLRLR